jgi:hypothetical protein
MNVLPCVRGSVTNNDRSWIGWLNLLKHIIHTVRDYRQLQRCCYSKHFPAHRCTCSKDSPSSLRVSWQRVYHRNHHFPSVCSLLAISCSIILECRPSGTPPSSPMLILSNLLPATDSWYTDSAQTYRKHVSQFVARTTQETPLPLLLWRHVYRDVAQQQKSYCWVHVCCGNSFTKPLPSNGYTRYSTNKERINKKRRWTGKEKLRIYLYKSEYMCVCSGITIFRWMV